jgi:hypothetical protein
VATPLGATAGERLRCKLLMAVCHTFLVCCNRFAKQLPRSCENHSCCLEMPVFLMMQMSVVALAHICYAKGIIN